MANHLLVAPHPHRQELTGGSEDVGPVVVVDVLPLVLGQVDIADAGFREGAIENVGAMAGTIHPFRDYVLRCLVAGGNVLAGPAVVVAFRNDAIPGKRVVRANVIEEII